jgi:hypothetical protein
MSTARHTRMLLDDTNYADWAVYMQAYLTVKDLADLIDGTESKPIGSDNDTTVRKWIRRAAIARAEIIIHLDPSQYSHVAEIKDPKEVWDALRTVHVARGIGSRLAMMRHLINMRMEGSTYPMEKWIADVRQAAHRLRQNEADINDHWIILVLTNGLTPDYNETVQSLDGVPAESLTLDYVIGRLLNAGAIRKAQETPYSHPSDEAALAAVSSRLRGKDVTQVKCYNCGGLGHIRSKCSSPRNLNAGSEDEVAGMAIFEPQLDTSTFAF